MGVILQQEGFLYPSWTNINLANQIADYHSNMTLPIHRWYKFPAGFSAQWVMDLILSCRNRGEDFTVLDPFAGSGTTVLCGEACGVRAIGLDAHPFLVRIAQAKLCWRGNVGKFKEDAKKILNTAKQLEKQTFEYPKLINDCYSAKSLLELHTLRASWEESDSEYPESELIWLAIVSILRLTCQVKGGSWQYILPRKQRKNPLMPFTAFENRINHERRYDKVSEVFF